MHICTISNSSLIHNDWDYNEIEIINRNEDIEDNEAGNIVGDFSIAQSSEHEECPHCLCRPYITSRGSGRMKNNCPMKEIPF